MTWKSKFQHHPSILVFRKYMKHMVHFSDQKISHSSPKTLSPHMYESQQILERMCSFCLYAPDATTVAYKQKYRNSWAIFSWTSLINLVFFYPRNSWFVSTWLFKCFKTWLSPCYITWSFDNAAFQPQDYRTIKCQPSTVKSNEEKKSLKKGLPWQ